MKTTKKHIVAFILMLAIGVNVIGMTVFAGNIQPRMDYCYVNTPNGGNLNGRSGPGTQYSIVCQFANGTSLNWSIFDEDEIDSEGYTWMQVGGRDINGKDIKRCWVRTDYLLFVRDWRSNNDLGKVYINPELEPVG